MPTVFLLDVSLSMTRPITVPDSTEPFQLRHLAIHGLNFMIDYMSMNTKLEFSALMVFSSLWELVVQFTRDFENLKTELMKVDCYDKTDIVRALIGVRDIILEEWGATMPCQIILITDGNIGIGSTSLKYALEKYYSKDVESHDKLLPLPFPFPCKLHVVCISDVIHQHNVSLYQKLIDIGGGGGQVFVPEGQLSFKSVQQIFHKLTEMYYKPFQGNLYCGNLKSLVSLSPAPESYSKARDFEWIKTDVFTDIVICGFLDIADVASPPVLSRHLVLPIPPVKEETKLTIKPEIESGLEDESLSNDEGKQPSFCVLLHGSLKVESMIALCQLRVDWYGMLYSWADSKKKSNLMLSTFEPGLDVIPWLGNIQNLGPISLANQNGDEIISLPLKPSEKRSYAQNCVVWIKQTGLQADIQKILRHARKLPEKTQNFYKELNRLRRAALSFGFYELLEGMATILDRECTLLPGSAHPDAALQLTHAASSLRGVAGRDYSTPIVPLRTKFSSDN